MDLGLHGKHAVICGGSSGIGRAAAESLALEGANITLVARNEETLASAAEAIANSAQVAVDYVAADLSLPKDRERLLSARSQTDILVCNPGVPQRPENFDSLGREEWDQWFDAHFYSALELIRGYLPAMREARFGRIVNISVSFIKFPQVNTAHSHAARLALSGAIASLVRELIPFNVTINSILPGLIDTPALRAAIQTRADNTGISFEEALTQTVKSSPAARMAEAHEIGDLVAMLSAASQGFMTGQNIVVDGGSYPGLF